MDNIILFKKNHCLQESYLKLFEQLKLRTKTTTKGLISFDQTQLENENKFFKEKVEKLSKDLTNFVAETKNLDKHIVVQRSLYDKASLGFINNTKKVFQKPNKVRKARRKCSNCNRWGQQTLESYRKSNISFIKVTNTQGPKKLWVPRILLLYDARMSAPQQEESVVVFRQWMLLAYDWRQKKIPQPREEKG